MLQGYVRLLKLAIVLVAVLPGILVLGDTTDPNESSSSRAVNVLLLLVAGGILGRFLMRVIDAWTGTIEQWSLEQARAIDALPIRWVNLAIVVAAASSLILELAIIRWQATVVPMLSIYKNFGLLACFAGLGMGYAIARSPQIPLVLVAPLLLFKILYFHYLCSVSNVLHALTPIKEEISLGLENAGSYVGHIGIHVFLAFAFLITAIVFVPIGQLCGRTMECRGGLEAYGRNLIGSVLGVVAMLVASWYWAPPTVWLFMALIGLLPFVLYNRAVLASLALVGMLLACVLSLSTPAGLERIYSPYQLIDRKPNPDPNVPGGTSALTTGGLYYQRMLNLRGQLTPEMAMAQRYYDAPYRFVEQAGECLILGAGTGNDVSAALRAGATSVDAVEIDPAILLLGRLNHPERPYQDARVNAICNDARTHLRTTPKTYDCIVYGLLDSHALLGATSTVRLDSFVYTVEGLREAHSRLRDGGALVISFCTTLPEMRKKFFLMTKEAFTGEKDEVSCLVAKYDIATLYVLRKGATKPFDFASLGSDFEDVTEAMEASDLQADISTDDWPFVYMPRRVYPWSYLGMIAMVLVLTGLFAYQFVPNKPVPSDAVFFLLGAGFMLVETKGITELGLAFGNTWQIIGIVIIGVLSFSFLANVFVARTHWESYHLAGAGLLLSLAFGYWISALGGFPPTWFGRFLTVSVLTVPIFFSGIVFSTLLRREQVISRVMSANLFGAMCGGLIEYHSMYFGFRALYVIAGILYLVAILLASRSKAV